MSIYISVPLYSKQDVYEVREFFPTPVALPRKEGGEQYYTMLRVDKPILGVRENQRIEMSHSDLEKCQVYMGVRYCSMSTSFYAPHSSCLWQSWNGVVGSERCRAGIGRDFVHTASLTTSIKLIVDTAAPHIEIKCLNQPNQRIPTPMGYAVVALEPGCVATTDRLRVQAETSPMEMETQASLALMVPLNFTIDELAAQLSSTLTPTTMVDRLEKMLNTLHTLKPHDFTVQDLEQVDQDFGTWEITLITTISAIGLIALLLLVLKCKKREPRSVGRWDYPPPPDYPSRRRTVQARGLMCCAGGATDSDDDGMPDRGGHRGSSIIRQQPRSSASSPRMVLESRSNRRSTSRERTPQRVYGMETGTVPRPDRKSTRLNSSHSSVSRMPSSA